MLENPVHKNCEPSEHHDNDRTRSSDGGKRQLAELLLLAGASVHRYRGQELVLTPLSRPSTSLTIISNAYK